MSTHDTPFSPDEQDRLEQELLELHFGCHEDPAPLQARLAAEPAVRALQQRVLAQAELLAQAARPEQAPLELPPPKQPRPRPRQPWFASPLARLRVAGGLAAAALLVAYVLQWTAAWRASAFDREHLHLTVSAPQSVPLGAPWSFAVEARDLSGRDAACRVRWQAFGETDTVLAAGETAVEHGRATVPMAADLRPTRRVEVVATHATDDVRHVLELSTSVAGPLVHVTTDRPVYRPGETIYGRAVVLDRVTLQPLPFVPGLHVRLLDAKGAPVVQQAATLVAGAGAFVLDVPAHSAGGTHRVEVTSAERAFAPETHDVVVRPFRNPQLRTTIVLDRSSYAPGARGSAAVRSERMGGGAAAGAAVQATLVLDGDEVWSERQPLDADGATTFRFVVPKDVREGAARFVATITDGAAVETDLRAFVVPTGRVLLHAHPEGGELVAGVENGLYLECTDPLGRPVDTVGALVDDRGTTVARFKTAHQGRCRLAFEPQTGRRYEVRLADRAEPFALPAVHERGLALRLPDDEVAAGAPVRLHVAGRGDGPWLVGVFCRGALVGQTTLRADDRGALHAVAEVPVPLAAAGVLRATVFDRHLQPVAERLLRRASAQRVQIELACAHASVAPGEPQRLAVRTRDEAGAPLAAMVGVSVADLAAVSLGSEPSVGLLDHAELFADARALENLGDFAAGSPHGARNADLLLGTRGWRRYVWRNDDAARQAIAAQGPHEAHLLAREGFAQTPQVASNLAAAQAAGAALHDATAAAERTVTTVAQVALLVILFAAAHELVFWLLRRARLAKWLLLATVPLALLVTWQVGNVTGAADFAPGEARVDFLLADAPVRRFAGGAEDAAPPARLLAWDADRLLAKDGDDAAPRPESKPAEVAEEMAPEADAEDDLRLVKAELVAVARDELAFAEEAKKKARQRVLVYAHQHTPNGTRDDLAPTILWQPLLQTDANGRAEVAFATSDAVTTWLVQASAHATTGPGRVGQAEARFATRLPFHLELKLPDEAAAGDALQMPIAAVVDDAKLLHVDLRVTVGGGLRLADGGSHRIELVGGRGRVLVPVAVGEPGTATLTVEGRAGRFTDRVHASLRVAPRGFPHRRSAGGTVGAGAPATVRIALPADAVPGSGRALLKLFPSPLSALTEGLQGILQEPCGCFEQASSSNYPNTLVLTLLSASGDDVPAVALRARELLPRGYARITGYECKEKGYEWFGGDPGHEALTAYGLLQFHDMASVHPVDAAMVERTRQWLLARRDGQGGWRRNERALDSFGQAPQPLTDAYVTYALLQSGVPAAELATELRALAARATTDDAYELALIANALELAGHASATEARERLAGLQQQDGSWRGATSITRSGGDDVAVETTGFAVLALLRDGAFVDRVRRGIEFVQGRRSANGTFGATQATIVALRTLTEYARLHRAMKAPGTLRVHAGERLVAERAFAAGAADAIAIDLWAPLGAGAHALTLSLDGGGDALPWALDVAYHSAVPADDPGAAVAIEAVLRQTTVAEGATVALDVTVTNATSEGQPMALARIGLPAGLDLPTRVLEDLQRSGAFAFWELRGRELALYWRDLAPAAVRRVPLDLVARVPGRSTGAASCAYLYYTPAARRWAAPLVVDVVAAK
jgi:hypothetical protein